MSDVTDSSTTEHDAPAPLPAQPVRSTRAVLGILGALAAIVVVLLLLILLTQVDWSKGADGPGQQLADGVDDKRVQAVYMTDGTVYFGRIRSGDGDWVVVEDAHFLREADAQTTKDSSTQDDSPQLVPMTQRLERGNGDIRVNANEVNLVEDLTDASPITRAIEDAS